jgi:predicted alpha-1,6-mannanase (GH76 family)
MFRTNSSKAIKEILRSITTSEAMVELETDLKEKSDEKIVELIKQDLLRQDGYITDRINMQRTGARSTSNDFFVREL